MEKNSGTLQRLKDALVAGYTAMDGSWRMFRNIHQAEQLSSAVSDAISTLNVTAATAWRQVRRFFPKVGFYKTHYKKERDVAAVTDAVKQLLGKIACKFMFADMGHPINNRYKDTNWKYSPSLLPETAAFDAGTLDFAVSMLTQQGIGERGCIRPAVPASAMNKGVCYCQCDPLSF